MNYLRILQAVSSHPWAILRSKLEAIAALLELKANGGSVSAEQLAQIRAQHAELEARAKNNAVGSGSVAVLPLYGVICHRASLFSDFSGGASTEAFLKDFRAAMADPGVSAVVIDVDSPGGTVDGIPEAADEIFRARGGKKKITAVANCLAASAAYWLACQADEFVCSPSASVGSIGVYQVHMDESQADAMQGVTYTLVAAGKYKTEANPHEPLSGEALGTLQQECNDFYSMFTAAVARGRKTSVDTVRNGFGEGRCLLAKAALKQGMVDRIATLDDVLSEHGVSRAMGALRGQAHATCLCDEDAVNAECPEHGRARGEILTPTSPQAEVPSGDAAPDPDAACACTCAACSGVEGCHACTNADCDDGNCDECPQQRDDNQGDDTAQAIAIERERRARDLQLASL